jgi:hypothetical protein
MDVAGLTISLIDLCVKLYQFSQSIKDAPEYARKLEQELTALEQTLESVKSVLGNKQSVVLETLRTKITTCLGELEKLSTKVNTEGRRARVRAFIGRLKWPLKEDETREYITLIDRLKASLMLELQVHEVYAKSVADYGAQIDISYREMQSVQRKKQATEREEEERRRRGNFTFCSLVGVLQSNIPRVAPAYKTLLAHRGQAAQGTSMDTRREMQRAACSYQIRAPASHRPMATSVTAISTVDEERRILSGVAGMWNPLVTHFVSI